MRLIDAEVFVEKIKSLIEWVDLNLEEDRFSEGCKASLKDALSTLKYFTPTVDAAPVVRCKNCVKHYTVHCTLYIGETRDEYGNSTCHYCGATARDDFFCPDGEAEADNDK